MVLNVKDRGFCENFYAGLNGLIADLDIKIVACAIMKSAHYDRYGVSAIDPYHLSLNVLVERFCFELSHSPDRGRMVAESRDAFLDNQIDFAFENLKSGGTRFLQGAKINREIESLSIMRKAENIAGLQIADAIVTPIARQILGKTSRIDYEVIKSKFRKGGDGRIDGHGLVILPKN